MTNTWVAICDDVASSCGIPTNSIKLFFNKRKNILRDVILSEIRQGDFSQVCEDDKIAICYRLMRDSMEGIAKNNLRLMARLICGLNEKEQLTAPNFQKYAKILADLDSDEIFILSKLVQHTNEKYAIDKMLIEMLGRQKDCDKNKFNNLLAILNSLTRTGWIGLQGGGMWADENSEYHTNFYITERFKSFVKYCPNWKDIATWEWEVNK